jgi:hypothetical protein
VTADGPDTSRTVDEETLRYVARLFGHQDEVRTTSLFPSNKFESLVVALDADYYPSDIDEVTLEARVYTNGEFHLSYIERQSGAQRRCRWDRHEQPHNSRDHFHPLPDASVEAAGDRTYPTEFTRVLETTVLPWIDDRVGQLWESA